MHVRFWRPSLQGRSATKRLVVGAAVLVLVVGTLTTSLIFPRPAAAASASVQHRATVSMPTQSGTPRLEVFGIGGPYYQVYHQWSDDNGANWYPAVSLPWAGLNFYGTPAVVSDGVGRLTVFASTTYNVYTNTYANGDWLGWQLVPGSMPRSLASDPTTASPTAASWGPGRIDLFVYGTDGSTGAKYLMHTWENNYNWSGQWEDLGPNVPMQGHPAAVSWGSGRIDVFAWGQDNELEHKWFDNGSWYGNWEDLGGYLTASPTVSSGGSGYLNIFVRDSNGGLSQRAHWPSGWGPWWNVDESSPIYGTPAVAETPGYIHVFQITAQNQLFYKQWTNQWWFNWSFIAATQGFPYSPTATAWMPPPPMAEVPNVQSFDQDAATTAINKAGFVLGSVTQDNTCKDVAGIVLFQNPVGGAVEPVGTAINLRVSSGLDKNSLPCTSFP